MKRQFNLTLIACIAIFMWSFQNIIASPVGATAKCKDITIQLDTDGQAVVKVADVDNGTNPVSDIVEQYIQYGGQRCVNDQLQMPGNGYGLIFGCEDAGTMVVEHFVLNGSGQLSNCQANVTISDDDKPTAICKDITVNSNMAGEAGVSGLMVDDGSSDNCIIANYNCSPSLLKCCQGSPSQVVLEVEDPAGNTASCTSQVTVNDNIAPMAVCQDLTVVAQDNQAGQVPANGKRGLTYDINGGSWDNCSIVTLTDNGTTFTCAQLGAQTITMTATDAAGNTASCTSNVMVIDQTMPVMVCKDVTVQLDAQGQASITTADVDDGSSDNCSLTLSLDKTSVDCNDIGGGGTFVDQQFLNNITGGYQYPGVAQTFTAGASGNLIEVALAVGGITSGSATLKITRGSGPGGTELYNQAVTMPAQSNSPNRYTLNPPVQLTQGVQYAIELHYPSLQPLSVGINTSINNPYAGGSWWAWNGTSWLNAGNGIMDNAFETVMENPGVSVTLTGTDPSQNSATCMANVTVEDVFAPTASCKDATITLDSKGDATLAVSDVNDGSSDNCGTPQLSLNETEFDCTDVPTATVTLTATDDEQNTATCTATVTVEDLVAPTAKCQDITVSPGGIPGSTGGIIPIGLDIDNGSSDNCHLASVTTSPSSVSCSDVPFTIGTLTATDDFGNISTANCTIFVADNTPPVAVCSTDVTVQLDTNGNGTLTTADVDAGSSDNCSLTLSLDKTSFSCSDIGGGAPVELLDQSQTNPQVQKINSQKVAQSFTAGMSGPLSSIDLDFQLNGAQTTDVDIAVYSGQVGSGSQIASKRFTFDATNNNSMQNYAFDQPAQISSGQSYYITIIQAGQTGTLFTGMNRNTDDYTSGEAYMENWLTKQWMLHTIAIDLRFKTYVQGSGGNVATLTATDAAQGTSSCTTNVTVVDALAPTAVCQGTTVTLDTRGNGSIKAVDIDGGSSDNCSQQLSLSASQTKFSCSDIPSATVTLTVSDAENNSSSCTASVTVSENIAPTAACKDITVQLNANGGAAPAAASADNGSFDNCGPLGFALSPASFECQHIGDNNATLTVTDAAGNSATCSLTVTVEDNAAPTALCQNVTVNVGANGIGSIKAIDVDGGSSDNCGIHSMAVSPDQFSCGGSGMTTLTLTDVNGNSSSCQAFVSVGGNNGTLTARCKPTITLGLPSSLTPADINDGSIGGCGAVNLNVFPSSFGCSDAGTHTVTLTATDASGATSSCTSRVTVADVDAPIAVCNDITLVFPPSGGTQRIKRSDVNGGSSDNCAITRFTGSKSRFSCADFGDNFESMTVYDAAGNSSSCNFKVTVVGCGVTSGRPDPSTYKAKPSPDKGMQATAFPNPFAGDLYLEYLVHEDDSDVRMQISDRRGRVVYSGEFHYDYAGEAEHLLPLEGLENGLYVVRVSDGKRKQVIKVLKQE